jgi:spore germination cell wall hydrolase CwlJ-like protein
MILSAAVFCLALTVYTEARGEPVVGQQAVALVVMNRSEWNNKRVCKTIHAEGQFPWAKPGMKAPHDKKTWARAQQVARAVMNGEVKDFTHGATYFLGKGERPAWRRKMKYVMTVGGHRFYASV